MQVGLAAWLHTQLPESSGLVTQAGTASGSLPAVLSVIVAPSTCGHSCSPCCNTLRQCLPFCASCLWRWPGMQLRVQ